MKNKFLLMGLLFSGFASAQAEYVSLHSGQNVIDINADGLKDILFIADYDNNTSHPSQTMNIFIKNKQGGYNSVPCPQASGFTWADIRLSASGVKIYDYRLLVYHNGYSVVSAEKFATDNDGSDVLNSGLVRINRYVITEGENDPGVPAFQWSLAGSYITKEKFNDVDEALKNINMDEFK